LQVGRDRRHREEQDGEVHHDDEARQREDDEAEPLAASCLHDRASCEPKNSASTGPTIFAATSCVCPANVRYRASGRASASERMPARIQAGLLPPSATSVGTFTESHRRAGSGSPRWYSRTIAPSCGSVWATAFTLDHTGRSGINAMKIPGAPTARR